LYQLFEIDRIATIQPVVQIKKLNDMVRKMPRGKTVDSVLSAHFLLLYCPAGGTPTPVLLF
jgi:hypothetical protein